MNCKESANSEGLARKNDSMTAPKRRTTSSVTKLLRPFKEVPVFEASDVLTEAYHKTEDRTSARLMMSARIKLLKDAASTMDLSVPVDKPKPVRRKKKAAAKPVEAEPVAETPTKKTAKSNTLDLNDAAELLAATTAEEEEAVAEQPAAPAPTGRAADPAFVEIFNEMVADTKGALTRLLDAYASDPAEGRSKAIAQAKNLSYAAEQMEFTDWKNTLDAFVANFPDDATTGETAVAGLILEIGKLSGDAPSTANAAPVEAKPEPAPQQEPAPAPEAAGEQPATPAAPGKNPDFSELAALAELSSSSDEEAAEESQTPTEE